nr:MAG TPA: hypothetical protein [Caudoviricetes sp.]
MAAVAHRSLNYHDPHQRGARCGCALSRVRLSQCANRNDIYNTTSRSHTGSHRLNVAHIGSTFEIVGIEPDAAGHGTETHTVNGVAQTDAVDGIERGHGTTFGGRGRDVTHGTARYPRLGIQIAPEQHICVFATKYRRNTFSSVPAVNESRTEVKELGVLSETSTHHRFVVDDSD